MKLYTEEQVRKAIEFARDTHREGRPYLERDVYDYSYDEIINMLTPIELPSDEEIYLESRRYEKYHQSMNELESERSAARYHGHMQGAKWMKEQILNQNK